MRPLDVPNQWGALRTFTRNAPPAVQIEAISRADHFRWAEPLASIPWNDLESNAALRNRAEKFARACQCASSLDGMERIAAGAGVDAASQKISRIGRVARLTCPYWWRRRLRKTWGADAEDSMRRIGLVHRNSAAYVTDWTYRRRTSQRRALRATIESARLISDAGEECPLEEAWRGSTANPAIRRIELMTRLRGFQRLAEESGHVARFFTLTAPSAFHVVTTIGGRPAENPRYKGGTARQAQEWFNRMWARIRAKLRREGLLIYGFRIVEPHHDGTPHWHLLLWMPKAQRVGV